MAEKAEQAIAEKAEVEDTKDPKVEDDLESMDDKMAWLRARGVTIDIPSERNSKPKTEDPSQDGPQHTFLYVKVPADTSKPFEQLQGEGLHMNPTQQNPLLTIDWFAGCGKLAADNMLTILKPFFAGGQIDADSARQQAISQVCSRFIILL
jgi:hypothetical protein